MSEDATDAIYTELLSEYQFKMEILNRDFDPEVVKRNFAKVLWIYDFWGFLTESKAAGRVIELCEIKDYSNILEVAVGTGLVFKKIVSLNPNGTNIGVDLSPDMLEKAEAALRKKGHKNYILKQGNALKLEFRDESFDTLVNNFMIDLMPLQDFDKIISEFYRILKKDGIAVISTFSFGYKKVNKLWYWIAAKFPGLLTGCRPVSIKGSLLKAGFRIENDEQISQNTFPSRVIRARR